MVGCPAVVAIHADNQPKMRSEKGRKCPWNPPQRFHPQRHHPQQHHPQVWDDDETSSDFLGGFELDIADILLTKNRQHRALTGPIKSEAEDPDDDFAPIKSCSWFETEEYTRIFDGSKIELKGSAIPSAGSPLIHFEAYFWPDWHPLVQTDEIDDVEGDEGEG